MNKKLLIMFGLFSVLIIKAQVYVKEGGTGDGSSWTNAMGDLQKAINKYPTRRVDAIRNYTPNNRDNAFTFFNNINVYGGFKGNETTLSQRDWNKYQTILSGDLGALGYDGDNAYHVVVGVGTLDI